MRKIVFLLLSFSAVLAYGQNKRDIFNPGTQITWLGVDFSQAKFIGDRERLGSHSDILRLMESINQLIINEPEKYNIGKAIGRDRIEKNIEVTLDHNASLDPASLLSNDTRDYARLRESDIEEIISSYDFSGLSGIGMMFNIEAFSKLDESTSVWVTFIDLASGKVLITQNLKGKPKGFGLRNYWGGSLYAIIEAIKKKEFEMWRARHS
jgi:hypothetical protein